MASWLSWTWTSIRIPPFCTMRVIVNSVYPTIGIGVVVAASKWHIWYEIRGWMPSDSRGFSMRVNGGKGHHRVGLFPSEKVRLHLMSQHYHLLYTSDTHTHTRTDLISCICFVFWEAHMGALCLCAPSISPNWMQVLGCLSASWNCDVAAWFWVPCIWRYLLF